MTSNQAAAAAAALQEAIERAGSKPKLAIVCGVSRQSVDKWVRRGYISHLRAKIAAQATGVDVLSLRPDVF